MHYTAASGSSVYKEGGCVTSPSCALRFVSTSAAHKAELTAAVSRNSMLKGGTNCRNKYMVPYLSGQSGYRFAFKDPYQVYCHLLCCTKASLCLRSNPSS
jgi:hypothetical protein